MTCSRFRDQISEYIDGEAEIGLRKDVETHAAACPACAALMDDAAGLKARLSRLPRVAPSAGFDFALRSRMSMEISRELERAKRPWRRFRVVTFPGVQRTTFAAAAILMLAASALFLSAGGSGKEMLQTADTTLWEPRPPSEVTSLPMDRGALKRLSEEESSTLSDHRLRPVRTPAANSSTRQTSGVQRVAVRF